MASQSKIIITKGFIANIFLLFGAVNLYLNDRLRAELRKIISENRLREHLKDAHCRSAKKYDYRQGRIEARNRINSYRRVLTSYATGRILETGCGTGRNFTYYKPSDEVLAVDYSDEMLSFAHQKYNQEDNEDGTENHVKCRNIKIRNLDVLEMDKLIEADSFDTVIDIMNMEAYYDTTKALLNIKRVLKNGGKLIVMCRGESSNIFIAKFYQIFYYTTMMKNGVDLTRNWDEFLLKDQELKCLYKERKNWGKTYLYIFELNKNSNI